MKKAKKKNDREKRGNGEAARSGHVNEAVIAALTAHLRATPIREEIGKALGCPPTETDTLAIDRALCDPGVQSAVNRATQAVLFEQGVAALRRVIDAAGNNEGWACKLLLDLCGLADIARASRPADDAAADAAFLSAAERRLHNHLRQVLHGPQGEDEQDAENRKGD